VRQLKARVARGEEPVEDGSCDGARWEMLEVDIRVLLTAIEPGTADAIVTDPGPYDDMEPYAYLAEIAGPLLRPGGALAVMAATGVLPNVLRVLEASGLDYLGMILLDVRGQLGNVGARPMFNAWKAMPVYTK